MKTPGHSIASRGTTDQQQYLFDMLWQLSDLAIGCGEDGVALALKTIILSRAGKLAAKQSSAAEPPASEVQDDQDQ